MSILGVVLGVIGALAALLASLCGIIGGIPAAVLGLLAVLFGFLAWKKAKKGMAAIIIGAIAVILAVVLTIGSINSAKKQYDLVKANPDIAPTVAKYLDKAKLEFGYIGLMIGCTNPDEDKVLTEEVIALIKGELPKTAETSTTEPAADTEAPAEAPAAETEAPTAEAAQ